MTSSAVDKGTELNKSFEIQESRIPNYIFLYPTFPTSLTCPVPVSSTIECGSTSVFQTETSALSNLCKFLLLFEEGDNDFVTYK